MCSTVRPFQIEAPVYYPVPNVILQSNAWHRTPHNTIECRKLSSSLSPSIARYCSICYTRRDINERPEKNKQKAEGEDINKLFVDGDDGDGNKTGYQKCYRLATLANHLGKPLPGTI